MRHAWLALVVFVIVTAVLPRTTWAAEAHQTGRRAPARPLVTHVRVELVPGASSSQRGEVSSLSFQSIVSPDTAALEITIEDRLGTQTLTTTPRDTHLFYPDLRLTTGQLEIDIVAIDHEGERSEPNTWHFVQAQVQRPYRCGLGPMIFLFMMPVLFVGAVLGLLFIRALLRALHGKSSAAAISWLLAEQIARRALGRAAGICLAGVVAFATSWLFGQLLLGTLIAAVAFISLSSVIAARRVLRVLEQDQASAELRGTLLVVRSPNRQAHLATTSRVIDKARTQAVPMSIAR